MDPTIRWRGLTNTVLVILKGSFQNIVLEDLKRWSKVGDTSSCALNGRCAPTPPCFSSLRANQPVGFNWKRPSESKLSLTAPLTLNEEIRNRGACSKLFFNSYFPYSK